MLVAHDGGARAHCGVAGAIVLEPGGRCDGLCCDLKLVALKVLEEVIVVE